MRWIVRTRSFLAKAITTSGEVAAVKEEVEHDANGLSTSSRPVVSFRTEGGMTIRFEAMSTRGPAFYRIGDRVTVVYDPLRPDRAHIRSFVSLWLLPLVLLGLGGAFVTIALGVVSGLISP